MAQSGYGLGPGPSRSGQYYDDALSHGRHSYDELASAGMPSGGSGRPTAGYIDGSPLLAASSSSYDHTGALRNNTHTQSSLSLHTSSLHDSLSPNHYNTFLPHEHAGYAQHEQPSPYLGKSSLHDNHHAHAYPHHHQHQPHHPLHGRHISEPHMSMPMPGEPHGGHSAGMHLGFAPHGAYGHPSQHAHHAYGSLDAERKPLAHAPAPEPHTPRPPNAWILYRSQKFRELQKKRDAHSQAGSSEKPKSQAEISRIISRMWQSETDSVKQRFEALADEKKLAHQRMYPTYRYRPKKKAKTTKANAAGSSQQQQVTDKAASESGDIKKEPGSSSLSAYQGRSGSDKKASSTFSHSPDPLDTRRSSADWKRPMAYAGESSMHQAPEGGEAGPRRGAYGSGKERGDLQANMHYGRSVSGAASGSEGTSMPSYMGARMHPCGDRQGLMRHESSRSSDVFGESQSSTATYAGSPWPDSECVGASSTSSYLDGLRGGAGTYAGMAGPRVGTSSSLVAPSASGSASLMSLSPIQRPSIPSQHLSHAMDGLNSDLSLAGLTGPSGGTGYSGADPGFRASPLVNDTARFGPTFGDARSEVPSGLSAPGANPRNLPEILDPHSRLQND
ncbi:hypothetical protein PANT_20c00062 [Moesziomyces antarcticus T-34]|uniref:HMG box domain-containing protein n=1 Tax=Pseudozyma antarctica (strain T-34) TaxID=1151754 RepID=M9M6E6_PSEA3|nr:hypothetical protein PANT_20c00062 [Moesziomyces antarcticus T-34]